MTSRAYLDYLKKSQRDTYPFTYFLCLVLILTYLLQIFYLGESLNNYLLYTSHIFNGTFLTVLTSLFFHADLIHLGTNLVALFLFGRHVEKHFGIGVIGLFLICGIIANIISSSIAYFQGDLFFSLGASSGIAGIVIFGLLLEPFSFTTILGWVFIISDIIGLSNSNSNVNHLAHIGGYFSLFVLFFFLEYKKRSHLIKGFLINLGLLIVLYFIVSYFGLTFSF